MYILKRYSEKNEKIINDKRFNKNINFPLQALISSKSTNLITSQYIDMVLIINIKSKLSVPEYSQYQMSDNQNVSYSHS